MGERRVAFSSTGVGIDGKPLVEVMEARLQGHLLDLSGTASAYEANVLVLVTYAAGTPERLLHFQASIGGPGRGEWSAIVDLDALPAQVTIGDEDAERGGISARSAIQLYISAYGVRPVSQP